MAQVGQSELTPDGLESRHPRARPGTPRNCGARDCLTPSNPSWAGAQAATEGTQTKVAASSLVLKVNLSPGQ